MVKTKEIIAVITVICFLLTNVSFAQETNNSFKLSPSSNFSSLKGLEFKEAAQIQAGIRMALKELQKCSLDLADIKVLGDRGFVEKSVFGKRIEGTIYFNEATEYQIKGKNVFIEKDSYVTKAATNAGKIYYCLVSKKQEGAGYDVSVVSERVLDEALKNGTVKFTHASISEKDKGIISPYTEHEISTENNIAIDEFIAERMERGEYSIDEKTAENPLYWHLGTKLYKRSNYTKLLNHILKCFAMVDIEPISIAAILDRMENTPLVLLSYKDESELPTISIGGEKVKVYAHSSEFATYIFIPEFLYSDLIHSTWSFNMEQYISYWFIHEIGAICGLKATVKNGIVSNELDECISSLSSGNIIPASNELKNITPVNLLDLELRNDYAAGDVGKKKGIFDRIIQTVVVGTIVAIMGYELMGLVQSPIKQEAQQEKNWYLCMINDSRAVELLSKEAMDPNSSSDLRVSCMRALGKIGDYPAIDILLNASKDKDESVRNAAKEAIDELVTKLIEDLLGNLDANDEDMVAYSAAIKLGLIGDKRAFKPLLKAVKKGNGDVREQSALALGQIGDSNASETLIEVVKTDNCARNAAMSALVSIGATEAAGVIMEYGLLHGDMLNRVVAPGALVKLQGSRATQGIIDALRIETYEPAIFSQVIALGDTNDDRAIEILAQIVEGTFKFNAAFIESFNCDIRFYAAMGLGSMKNIKVIKPLINALNANYLPEKNAAKLRAEAAFFLGIKGAEAHDALPLLKELVIKDKYELVRDTAREAIEKIQKAQGEKKEAPPTEPNAQPDLNKIPERQSSLMPDMTIPHGIARQMDNITKAIPSISRMPAATRERVNQVTEILWQAGLGSMSTVQAKQELAKIVPEVGAKQGDRDKVYDTWIATSRQMLLTMLVPMMLKHNPPSDDDIRQIATKIKESGVELFIPKSRFPGDVIGKYREVIESIGGNLQIYQHVEDLQSRIKNPAKSIIMTAGASDKDLDFLQELKSGMQDLRLMNFAEMKDLAKMQPYQLDNYEADILSILLVARLITPEDLQDKGSTTYQLLAHLLEDYMPDDVTVENYIEGIVANATRFIKTILKALPATAYKMMRQSVEALWSV